jgi:hypothetical protein
MHCCNVLLKPPFVGVLVCAWLCLVVSGCTLSLFVCPRLGSGQGMGFPAEMVHAYTLDADHQYDTCPLPYQSDHWADRCDSAVGRGAAATLRGVRWKRGRRTFGRKSGAKRMVRRPSQHVARCTLHVACRQYAACDMHGACSRLVSLYPYISLYIYIFIYIYIYIYLIIYIYMYVYMYVYI